MDGNPELNAAGVAGVYLIKTGENLDSDFTKQLHENNRDYLFGNWTY